MTEQELIQKHDEILDYFLRYKKEHSNFTFSPRKNHNDIKNEHASCRLCKRYWFQGGNDYIFVALYQRGCKDNKTKTIGFVFKESIQYIEIVYKKVEGITEDEYKFYSELISYLNKSKKFIRIERKHEKKFFYILHSTNLQMNLDYFLNDIKKKADELIIKHQLDNKYFITEKELDERLIEINRIKHIIDNPPPPEPAIYCNIKNIILYGSPGVGKTHNVNTLISLIEDKKSEKEIFEIIKTNEFNNGRDINDTNDRMKFITFHQSFGYEDFIEGFRPNEDGDIKLKDGIFKSICDDANKDKDNKYYLVIDEINRGNISKIFGELITLIEEDKRDTLEVTLPYSKKPFKIPSNLYIIGTMNSTDKSIALIDIALRRRFTFLKMEPNLDLVDNVEAKNIMKRLNEKITEVLGADYVLGHSYFMKIESDDDLDFVLEYKIKPLLEEYFYGDMNGYDQVIKVIDDNV